MRHALWICACVTFDDAPTWLIHDQADGITWCRVPNGREPLTLVDARAAAGGHADPTSVLAWLNGTEPDPWLGGDGWGESSAVLELGRLLRGVSA